MVGRTRNSKMWSLSKLLSLFMRKAELPSIHKGSSCHFTVGLPLRSCQWTSGDTALGPVWMYGFHLALCSLQNTLSLDPKHWKAPSQQVSLWVSTAEYWLNSITCFPGPGNAWKDEGRGVKHLVDEFWKIRAGKRLSGHLFQTPPPLFPWENGGTKKVFSQQMAPS